MSNFDKNFEAARLAMLAKQHSDIVKVITNAEPVGVCSYNERLVVGLTTVGNFGPTFLRHAIGCVLTVQWVNERCKYCDSLVGTEGACEACLLLINTEKCHFCKSTCGRMLCKRLKRGRNEPKVHYHGACKKRKLNYSRLL